MNKELLENVQQDLVKICKDFDSRVEEFKNNFYSGERHAFAQQLLKFKEMKQTQQDLTEESIRLIMEIYGN